VRAGKTRIQADGLLEAVQCFLRTPESIEHGTLGGVRLREFAIELDGPLDRGQCVAGATKNFHQNRAAVHVRYRRPRVEFDQAVEVSKCFVTTTKIRESLATGR